MNQDVKLEDLEKVYVDLPNHWAVGANQCGRNLWMMIYKKFITRLFMLAE